MVASGQLRALLARLLETVAPASPVPLGDWLAAVEAEYQRPHRALSTCSRTRQACRDAASMARAVRGPLASTLAIDPRLVEALTVAWAQAKSPATVNGLLRGLRAGVGLAIRRGWLVLSPFDGSTPWQYEGDGVRRGFLDRDDLGRLWDRLAVATDWRGGRLHACAAVLMLAGLRRDEALSLEWADVDLVNALILVKPKYSSRNRRWGLKTRASAGLVPMPDQLAHTLREWRTRVPSACPWVFPGVTFRGAWTSGKYGTRLSESLRVAGESVGLAGVTPHVLRRSLATALRGYYGLSAEQLRGVLRHATVSNQAPYLKRDLSEIAAAVRGVRFGVTAVGSVG